MSSWVAAEELPLPSDVPRLGPPAELVMGSQPVKAQEFATALSMEEVRAFYETALPRRGWRLLTLPWMSQVEGYQGKLDEAVQQHAGELETNPSLRGQIEMAREGFGMLEQHMRGSLYAGQGEQRLLLNFSPEDGRTVVTVQRWEGGSPFGEAEGPGGGQPLGAGGGPHWPEANPCCSGGQVPEALRQLPSSIPRYPNGRMFSTGAAPESAGGRQSMTEMYLSDDSIERVSEFYRAHMAYHGWSLAETPSTDEQISRLFGPQASQVKSQFLVFRNAQGLCGVVASTFAGLPAEAVAQLSPEYLANNPFVRELVKGPDAAAQSGPTERTLIVVTYTELDPALVKRAQALQRRPHGRRTPQ